MAVRLVILFLEGSLVELSKAKGTDEMFRMELSEHCRDASARYGLMTAGAQGATFAVVVSFAVRLTFVLEE